MSSLNLEIRRHRPEAPWTYALLDQRQREIAAQAREGGPGALLLSEVAPVITVGRRTAPGDVLLTPEALALQGISLHPTDRGGLATWHGPGQWVLFVVDRLESLTGDRRGVRRAVEGLLTVAHDVSESMSASATDRAEIREGCEMGVWNSHGKFAAVGVHIAQGVLLHGLSVNGFRTPTSFQGLRPCGLDAPVSYLLADPERFDELGQRLIDAACRRFWH